MFMNRLGDSGIGWFWGIGALLVFIAVILLVVWLVLAISRESRHTRGGPPPGWGQPGPPTPPPGTPQGPPIGPPAGPAPSPALDILRERFARGEIDEAQFEQARRVLER